MCRVLHFLIRSEISFDILSVVVFIILAVNIEKQDRERSEKETDLDGKALGKSEKELMVIDNLSYQEHNIAVIYEKIQFINKLIINFKNFLGNSKKSSELKLLNFQ